MKSKNLFLYGVVALAGIVVAGVAIKRLNKKEVNATGQLSAKQIKKLYKEVAL